MDKILLMLQLQNQLNEATNGDKWTDGITKNGKTINWRRCIYMECAEMVDSFSWKHWKSIDKEPDWDNHQIEVVDVWHFIMSLAIEEYSKNLQGGVEDLGISIAQYPKFDMIITSKENFSKQEDVIEQVEKLIRLAINEGKLDLEKLITDFFSLVIMSGLTLDTLYRLYVGKNILNQFRQDHGYKDGSYIKVWNGEEDNVVMKRVWEGDSNIKPDMLYKELAKVYLSLEA